MLDISGVAHLFEGEAALIEDCRARLSAQGITVVIGAAGNPRAASALARFSRVKTAPEPMSDKAFAKLFHDLPLAALGLDEKIVADMARAGLRRIGDIALRPRAPITARFGAVPMARLDALKGLERSSIAPRFRPPDFCAERRFASPIQTVEAIEVQLRKLADDLVVLLERQAKGARRIELSLYRVDGACAPHPYRRLPAAQRSARDRAAHRRAAGESERRRHRRRLWRRPHAPRLPHGRAARALRSRARARARGRARPFACRASRPALRAARGPRGDAARAYRCASARAGRGGRAGDAWARRGCVAKSPRRGLAGAPARPLRLFARPEPIEALAEVPDGPPLRFRWRRVLHDVTAIEGPERIAAPWWRQAGAPTRDYFRAEDSEGRRFWLYREGLWGRETAQAEMVCAWPVRVRGRRRRALLTRERAGGQHVAQALRARLAKSRNRLFAEKRAKSTYTESGWRFKRIAKALTANRERRIAGRQGHSERPPSDDLPLQAAGRVWRSPHDDAPARRARSAPPVVGARHRARAEAAALALRHLRQLRRRRLVFRLLDVAPSREPLHRRADRRRPAGRRDRPAGAVLSLFLRAPRNCPTSRGRWSASTAILPATSTAGCASS